MIAPHRIVYVVLLVAAIAGYAYQGYSRHQKELYQEKWSAWACGRGPHPDPEAYLKRIEDQKRSDSTILRWDH